MIIITNKIYNYKIQLKCNTKTAGTWALNAFKQLFLFLNTKLNV